MLWGVCSLRVSLPPLPGCERGGSGAACRAAAREVCPGPPGWGSLPRSLVPAGLRSSLFLHAGLAPPHRSASALPLPPLLLAPLPHPWVGSRCSSTRSVGVQLRPPAPLTRDPSPLQGLGDDKGVSPAFSQRDEGFFKATIPGRRLLPGASFRLEARGCTEPLIARFPS